MIDKRTFLYIMLAVIGMLLWNQWSMEHAPVVEAKSPIVTTASATPTGESPSSDLPPASALAAAQQAGGNPAAASSAPSAALPSSSHGQLITVTTDTLQLIIDTKGGNVLKASLPKYSQKVDNPDAPVQMFSDSPDNLYIAQSGLMGTNGPDTSKGQVTYHTDKTQYELPAGQETLSVDLKWHDAEGLAVTKRFVLKRGQYDLNVEYLIDNKSDEDWHGSLYAQIQRLKTGNDGGMFGMHTYTGAAISSEQTPYEKISYKSMSKSNLSRTITGGWVAMQEQYFVSAWIPNSKAHNHFFSRVHDKDIYTIGYVAPELSVPPGSQATTSARMYVGPELQEELDKLAPHLGKTIDFGWLFFLSQPIYWLLAKINSFVGNWGWSIILITLIIKLVFYKLSESSYRSMAKMRDLQPRMTAMKERFGDDRQKMSQAMMELYRKEKVNPLGGCLPMLIQMPFFIALYYVLIASVHLRHAPWILWVQDLSAPDPYYILPGLMMLAMLMQTRLSPTPPDRTQAIMMYVMPLGFSVFFATFPAGLVLYWFVNILFSIAQQAYIMQKFAGKKLKKVKVVQ
jgi:YidC/Oxa1 family membrane protein insertase